MSWQSRFDRLLKAMSQGDPHKAEKRQLGKPNQREPAAQSERCEVDQATNSGSK